MSADEIIQAKIYRLEELRKYQAYYGPHTPYPVIVEMNELELELRRILGEQATRPTRVAGKKVKRKRPRQAPKRQFWRMSQATIDAIATIAFIGLVFLLGSIVFAAYMQTRPEAAIAHVGGDDPIYAPPPTLRPTFTPTGDPNNPALPVAEVAAAGNLPAAQQAATEVPTLVPTVTPTASPIPTDTPLPTDTPIPTQPLPTATPTPPTPTPAPDFPFVVAEQGNRMFQKTTYHVITLYLALVTADNAPIGGLKVVGDHAPSGEHRESALSDWNWSVVNCVDCDYIKSGNAKLELGPFTDGVWHVYVADPDGIPLSAAIPLAYSADPEQWVWDFLIFKKNDVSRR